MPSSDATTCAVCGGEFSSRRVIVEGIAMHPRCAVMSYGSHTHDDLADASSRLWNLYEAAKRFEERLSSDCDCPERDALRAVLASMYCREKE